MESNRRPTVVVETEDGAEAVALWHELGQVGFHVEWCPGPNDRAHRTCLLASHGRCTLVERADVVLSHLDFATAESRECAAALDAFYPETPVVVSASEAVLAAFPEIASGHVAVAYPGTGTDLIDALSTAMGA